MRIMTPDSRQLSLCLDIEKSYGFGHDDWKDQGFFLPGATPDIYQRLATEGYARCLTDDAGTIVSFLLALLAGHPLMDHLLNNPLSTLITDSNLKIDFTQTIWIAKIATAKNHHRLGYAQQLYRNLFEDYPTHSVFTATALSPQRNLVSEQFHHHLNFHPCGIFLGSPTEHISHPVSLIWHKK